MNVTAAVLILKKSTTDNIKKLKENINNDSLQSNINQNQQQLNQQPDNRDNNLLCSSTHCHCECSTKDIRYTSSVITDAAATTASTIFSVINQPG